MSSVTIQFLTNGGFPDASLRRGKCINSHKTWSVVSNFNVLSHQRVVAFSHNTDNLGSCSNNPFSGRQDIKWDRSFSRGRFRFRVTAAAQSPYTILGVTKQATDKEIKSAYRKLALKFHPDVNKAPDAEKKFVEIKQAYQTLIDPKTRAREDNSGSKTQGSKSSQYDPFNWSTYGRSTQQEEEFYGFGDFLRDLDMDMQKRTKKYKGSTKSLWEELEEIGGEFLEFLEKNMPEDPNLGKQNFDVDDYLSNRKKSGETEETKAKGASSQTTETQSAQNKGNKTTTNSRSSPSLDKEIDDMLNSLKKELGL